MPGEKRTSLPSMEEVVSFLADGNFYFMVTKSGKVFRLNYHREANKPGEWFLQGPIEYTWLKDEPKA